MNIITLCLLSLSFSAETNDYKKYDDPGECICDVTADSCDESCCCDPDCLSSFDWSDCAAERYSTYGEKYCADSSQIFKINKRRGMKTTSGGSSEKCVKIDNSAKIEGFHSIVSSVSSSKVSDRVKDSQTYDDLFVINIPAKSSNYDVGDAVSSITAYFPDPMGNCIESQVGFMMEYNGTCVTSGLLSDICMNNLNITLDYDSVTMIDYSTNKEIKANPKLKTYYSAGKCINAVIQTTLTIVLSSKLNSIQDSKTIVDYLVTNLSSTSSISVRQSTNIKYVSSSSYVQTSGNPGYLKTRPLKINKKTPTYLRLTGKAPSGECSDSSFSDSAINFGIDTVYTCSISKTYESLKSYCKDDLDVTSIQLFKSLLDISNIGKWGVSDSETDDDWVSITSSSSKTAASFSSGTCKLDSVLVLNIYYTSIGSFSNPQFKVVYSTRSFKTEEWKFSKKNSSEPQTFLYTAVVNFIPYNSDSDPYHSPKRKDSIMPQNVLDPVRTTSSSLFLGFAFFFLFN